MELKICLIFCRNLEFLCKGAALYATKFAIYTTYKSNLKTMIYIIIEKWFALYTHNFYFIHHKIK